MMETLQEKNGKEKFPSVAVISPYREQVRILKDLLQHNASLMQVKEHISINTIDGFQGQERDIVYISLTRSNPDNRIGFLSDIRRMNVAMTRARKKLVVVGDSGTLSQFPFYAGFIAHAERKDGYKSAWEFMEVWLFSSRSPDHTQQKAYDGENDQEVDQTGGAVHKHAQ